MNRTQFSYIPRMFLWISCSLNIQTLLYSVQTLRRVGLILKIWERWFLLKFSAETHMRILHDINQLEDCLEQFIIFIWWSEGLVCWSTGVYYDKLLKGEIEAHTSPRPSNYPHTPSPHSLQSSSTKSNGKF